MADRNWGTGAIDDDTRAAARRMQSGIVRKGAAAPAAATGRGIIAARFAPAATDASAAFATPAGQNRNIEPIHDVRARAAADARNHHEQPRPFHFAQPPHS